jgi:uncharacterized membrane protein YeaQ/YmgE (transglycosylase-associated protein family)
VSIFISQAQLQAIYYKVFKKEDAMGILAWIVLGGIAGWIASMVAGNNEEQGIIGNIIIGILGAFIGGFFINLVGGEGITGFNLWSLLVAVGGAVLLLLILGRFRHTSA